MNIDWPTVGTGGGIFAGIVAMIAATGRGVAWLLNYNDARAEHREKRLSAWEASLRKRETEMREQIEGRLKGVEIHVIELRRALSGVLKELRKHVTDAPVIDHAESVLAGIKRDQENQGGS